MTDLVVRRLLIDLQPAFQRTWCGGDAFSTALFNALSMSFPFGEQFFIDAVKAVAASLPRDVRSKLDAEVKGFVGQEATHRRIHSLFNAQLERQGLVDTWTPRMQKRLRRLEGADSRHALAITAAAEHFTALFAEWLLAHPQALEGAEPRLKAMWLWHSAEEAEHKSTAFDVYRAAAGSEQWRRRWFIHVTFTFLTDLMRQTMANLRTNGELWKMSTWHSAARVLLGRNGLLRSNLAAWRSYLSSSFHPSQQASSLSQRWLEANVGLFRSVGTERDGA